jgi:hypothetical protein
MLELVAVSSDIALIGAVAVAGFVAVAGLNAASDFDSRRTAKARAERRAAQKRTTATSVPRSAVMAPVTGQHRIIRPPSIKAPTSTMPMVRNAGRPTAPESITTAHAVISTDSVPAHRYEALRRRLEFETSTLRRSTQDAAMLRQQVAQLQGDLKRECTIRGEVDPILRELWERPSSADRLQSVLGISHVDLTDRLNRLQWLTDQVVRGPDGRYQLRGPELPALGSGVGIEAESFLELVEA